MPVVIKVTSKFQITIPADFRMMLELQKGDLMEVTVVDGGILFRPVKDLDHKSKA